VNNVKILSALLAVHVLFLPAPTAMPVYIKAQLMPTVSGSPNVTVRLDGASDQKECVASGSSAPKLLPGTICVFQAEEGLHDLLVQIKVPGYKRFSRNVVSFRVKKQSEVLDIGTAVLAKSEIPQIKEITVAKQAPSPIVGQRGALHKDDQRDQTYRLRIVLQNSAKKSFFVTGIYFQARMPGASCNTASPEIDVSLGDKIAVEAKGGDTSKIVGSVLDKSDDRKLYVLSAAGGIHGSVCSGGVSFELNIPAGFVLPADEYVTVNLYLPQQFELKPPLNNGNEQLSHLDVMGEFTDHFIRIVTSDEDEPEIIDSVSFR
jgi:hypothetical protein